MTARKARPAELSAIRQMWADLGGLLRRTGSGLMLAPHDQRLIALAQAYASQRGYDDDHKRK